MTSTPENSIDFGSLSEDIFSRAAIKYSASVAGQALYISLECKKHDFHPARMETYLIDATDSSERRHRLSQRAERMHQHISGEKPNIDPDKNQGLKGVATRVIRLSRFISNEFFIDKTATTDELQAILDSTWETHLKLIKGLTQQERAVVELAYEKQVIALVQKKAQETEQRLKQEEFTQDHPLMAKIVKLFRPHNAS